AQIQHSVLCRHSHPSISFVLHSKAVALVGQVLRQDPPNRVAGANFGRKPDTIAELRPEMKPLTLIGRVLLAFSYLFNLLLSLFLSTLGIVTVAGGKDNLRLGMLPWEGAALTRAVLLLGIGGIVCLVLAWTRILRFAFPLWALFILILMFRGYFLSPYTFPS